MYNEPIFLQPVFQERIWGGTKLNSLFGYHIPSDRTGEAWVISAHKNGPSEILNGSLKGKTMLDAWQEHPELFGKQQAKEAFPLLVKILDANDNLSVQVHPDDTYAQEVEDEPYGKTECWYVLHAEPDAEIIFGHHAQTKEEFLNLVERGRWDDLLRRVKVKQGDFFYVPSGTIHAIGSGIVILETQQSSDITYRVYDYDRTDDAGNKRQLHIQSSADVTHFPHHVKQQNQMTELKKDLTSTRLVEAEYFTVYHWKLAGKVKHPLIRDYILMSVIFGQGKINTGANVFDIKKGDHFFLPANVTDYELEGNIELIVSHE